MTGFVSYTRSAIGETRPGKRNIAGKMLTKEYSAGLHLSLMRVEARRNKQR